MNKKQKSSFCIIYKLDRAPPPVSMPDLSRDQLEPDISEEEADENDAWEDWEDDEHVPVKSLFSDDTFPTVQEALAYDAEHHHFDLQQLISTVSENFIAFLKSRHICYHESSNRMIPPTTVSIHAYAYHSYHLCWHIA